MYGRFTIWTKESLYLEPVFYWIHSIHFIFRTCHITKVYIIGGSGDDDDVGLVGIS